MKRILAAVQGLVIVSATACYDYARVPFEDVHPGMEVRAGITGAGLDRVRQATGQGTFSSLELTGQVMDVGPDTVYLGVPLSTFARTSGPSSISSTNGEATDLIRAIALPRADVTGTEERRLDRRKTFIAIAAGSFLTAYAVYRLKGGGSMTPTTVVTSPPENRLPIGAGVPR